MADKKFKAHFNKEAVNYKQLKIFIVISSLVMLLYGFVCLFFYFFVEKFEWAVICSLVFLLVTPILSILFGFYSYAITKRVILPNLCLFLTYQIFIGGFIGYIIEGEKFFFMFFDCLPISCIVTGISLITSFFAMLAYRFSKKARNNKEEL